MTNTSGGKGEVGAALGTALPPIGGTVVSCSVLLPMEVVIEVLIPEPAVRVGGLPGAAGRERLS